jgi:hypothetical protein
MVGYLEQKPLTITMEYRESITTGARWVARVLAPWVDAIESVIVE